MIKTSLHYVFLRVRDNLPIILQRNVLISMMGGITEPFHLLQQWRLFMFLVGVHLLDDSQCRPILCEEIINSEWLDTELIRRLLGQTYGWFMDTWRQITHQSKFLDHSFNFIQNWTLNGELTDTLLGWHCSSVTVNTRALHTYPVEERGDFLDASRTTHNTYGNVEGNWVTARAIDTSYWLPTRFHRCCQKIFALTQMTAQSGCEYLFHHAHLARYLLDYLNLVAFQVQALISNAETDSLLAEFLFVNATFLASLPNGTVSLLFHTYRKEILGLSEHEWLMHVRDIKECMIHPALLFGYNTYQYFIVDDCETLIDFCFSDIHLHLARFQYEGIGRRHMPFDPVIQANGTPPIKVYEFVHGAISITLMTNVDIFYPALEQIAANPLRVPFENASVVFFGPMLSIYGTDTCLHFDAIGFQRSLYGVKRRLQFDLIPPALQSSNLQWMMHMANAYQHIGCSATERTVPGLITRTTSQLNNNWKRIHRARETLECPTYKHEAFLRMLGKLLLAMEHSKDHQLRHFQTNLKLLDRHFQASYYFLLKTCLAMEHICRPLLMEFRRHFKKCLLGKKNWDDYRCLPEFSAFISRHVSFDPGLDDLSSLDWEDGELSADSELPAETISD